MIINEKMKKELIALKNSTNSIIDIQSLTDVQLENYLRTLERARYNILNEIKLHNKIVEHEYEKIKTIDNEYKAELTNGILKIYIPELLPSYKNFKTHTHKRILLNVAEITKQFANKFKDEVFVYIKVFDKILGWDIDNRYIKPIADGLLLANVIQDDNITKMCYGVKGEYSEEPHVEVYIFSAIRINNFLEEYIT